MVRKILLAVVGAYLLLMTGTGLVGKFLFSGAGVGRLTAAVQSAVGVPVSAEGGSFDLLEWFRFRPAVTLREVRIGNPPFGGAREVSAQVGLFSLFGSRPEIRRLTVVAPRLRIARDRGGRSNLEGLVSGGGGTGGSSGRTWSIGELTIRSGGVEFPGFMVRDLNVALADFAPDQSCRMSIEGRLFGGEVSRFAFRGRAGPARPESVPAEGDVTVEFAPAEMPAAPREEIFGDLLRAPDRAARASLEVGLQGDLLSTMQGKGKFTVKDLHLGRNQTDRLPLRGEAPLQVTARRLLTAPLVDLRVQDASLQLGQGRWTGRARVQLDGSRVQGESTGAIRGVEIGQMLAAFTEAKGRATGIAEVPEYQVKFAGQNAAEVRQSLTGQGVVTLDKGKFAIFDLLASIERRVTKVLTSEAPAEGETDFTRFRTGFRISGGKIFLEPLALENNSSQTTGQGFLTFEQEMSLDLETTVTGRLATLLGGRPDAEGNVRATVPVKVRGTVRTPKVYPDVGQIVSRRVKGLMDRLLKK
jgi:hypothetical protein